MKPVASPASDQQRSSIFPSITGGVLVRIAARDLIGPRAADAGFAPMKNVMIGRLIMMNRMFFMLLWFIYSACRSLYDNLGCLFIFIMLRASRLPKFTIIAVFLQPPATRFMPYFQHILLIHNSRFINLEFSRRILYSIRIISNKIKGQL